MGNRFAMSGLRATCLFVALVFTWSATEAEAESRTPLTDIVVRIHRAGSDSLGDMPQIADRWESFAAALRALDAGRIEAAVSEAGLAGYELREFVQNEKTYYLLLERAQPIVGPLVILARSAARNIIVSAPHPVVDRATDVQAVIALERLGARAAVIAGAHRCAAAASSPCSGKTSVCGASAPYRTSDAAHNPATLFHVAHVVMTGLWPESIVLQLHGFSRKDTDAWAVISDTSSATRSGGTGLAERLRDGVRTRLARPERAVSCHDPLDDKYRYRKLCARTNVQGRALNGSIDICRVNAAGSSERFLHVEQSWDIREPLKDHLDAIDRYPEATAVIDALGDIVPCTLSACR